MYYQIQKKHNRYLHSGYNLYVVYDLHLHILSHCPIKSFLDMPLIDRIQMFAFAKFKAYM